MASAQLQGAHVQGEVVFVPRAPDDDCLVLLGGISGLTPGPHGFHIHTSGSEAATTKANCCDCLGGHLEQAGNNRGLPSSWQQRHGGLHSLRRHAGDLGNIYADAQGNALIHVVVFGLRLQDVVGRSLIVHADRDDLGRGSPTSKSGTTGNSGARLACGVIEPAAAAVLFELPDPLDETYGRPISVQQALEAGERAAQTIKSLLPQDAVVLAHTLNAGQGVHEQLARAFHRFYKAHQRNDTMKELAIDALQLVPLLQDVRKMQLFGVRDWLHVLHVAAEFRTPLSYLYVFDLLLGQDDLKLEGESPSTDERYDLVGYTRTQRERIKETLPFYAEVVQIALNVPDSQLQDMLYVLANFIDDGPLLVGPMLRLPIPLHFFTY